jgi:hypothetical protein
MLSRSNSKKRQSVPRRRGRQPFPRTVLVLLLAAAPAACALPEAGPRVHNPFIGTWATADNDTITVHQDTIVQNRPDGQSTALDKSACDGVFSFVYATRSSQALTGLIVRQPDLRENLSELLVEPTYSVAELDCGYGDQTYVLLNDRQLVAIYRDGDIAAIERLARR